MAKKLIQACAVFIAVTAIIYGNKPIQQPQQTFGARSGGGGGGTSGGFAASGGFGMM